MCRHFRSRCATSPVRATPSPPCWRVTLAAGADWETALRTANAAAAVAVGKSGTATVTPAELRRKILPHALLAAEEKIVGSRRRSRRASDGMARAGPARRFHQWLLRYSASRPCQGADGGACRLRPADRRPQQRCLGEAAEGRGAAGAGRAARAPRCWRPSRRSISSSIFEEDTPIKLITRIKPSVLVKGGDYTREQVVGHEIVEATGGEVVLVDICRGISTTSLVNRARGARRERRPPSPSPVIEVWRRWRDPAAG